MLLFTVVGAVFLCANLIVGWFLRPSNPSPEKKEIYECGEPTIGSSYVQFDLRFYVVALIFIVFDAEVAFLFPLSTAFGKAANLASPSLQLTDANSEFGSSPSAAAVGLQRELGISNVDVAKHDAASLRQAGRTLAWSTFAAINTFFVVLLIGFAYEWRTGALDWVKALSREKALDATRRTINVLPEEAEIAVSA